MDVVAVIVTIGGYFVDPIKKHCGYLFHCHSNTEDLKDRIQKLLDETKKTETEIDIERRNGRVITRQAEAWMEKVGKILGEDDEANNMSLNGWRPRYSLSRRAKKKTLKIDGLLEERQSLIISLPLPPLGMKPLPVKDIMDFGSRTNKMDEVLEALRDDKVNMIAICGMGGIGKTSMAKVVANRAKFDEVAFAVVSQDKGESKIQDEIARMLGLELDEKDPLLQRAERLRKRLMGSKSVLVILDDVWDAVDLEAVGIPYGGEHNRCKILLTSRSEDACTQMKTQKIIPIKVLPEEEAWNLFRGMAGNCIDTPKIHPIAKEVTKECGGLPVAIVTVGRALENKSELEWSAALQQLQNAIPENITGLDSKVYSSIELSYRYLKSDEAKSCFLLCCLFPEDYDILIEFLVRYVVGQRLFAKIDTVAEARNRVHAMVKNLKRSFLLLDSDDGEQFVKMHDVVRDVAISIAENQGFLVRCKEKMEEWPDSCERSTAISILTNELKRHPDGLECPKLELLHLGFDSDISQMLPHNLFKGMKGLKVLSLSGMSFTSLPQSINVLQNLRTLQFFGCEITDVSAIGELRKLEILSFIDSKIKELPGEMRNLSCLKLLELAECSDLERIPPDLLSSLSHLEELYIFEVDVKWKPMEEEEVDEEGEEEKKGANASLTELMSLSYLVALKIQIPNIKVLPKDLPFKNEMIKFQIFAGDNKAIDEDEDDDDNLNYLFENSLELASCDLSDIAGRQMLLQLLKRSEILRLEEIKDLKNIAYELDKEGFQCLKVLKVARSEDVEYVMDATSYLTPHAAFPFLESLELEGLANLKEIYHSQFPDRSSSGACFGSLKSLRLRTLPRLIGFCTGVGPVELVQPSLNQELNADAKLLVELQNIKIRDCDAIENIVQRDGEKEVTDIKAYSFEWSSIKKIYLWCCPKLKTIGSKIQSPRKSKKISRELDSRPNEQELGSPGFVWRCLECVPRRKNYGLMVVSDQGTTNKSQRSYSMKEEDTSGKPNDPKVGDSNNPSEIWSLFPSHIIECLKNLESIELNDVPSPEVIFQLEELNVEESHMAPILDQLRELDLSDLPKLMHIWKKGPKRILGFGNLRLLKLWKCDSLTYLFSPSIAKLLVMLEEIKVSHCEKIEEILARAGEEEKEKDVLFHKVNSILLCNLPNLKCFCPETNALEWPSLERITVVRCGSLSTFIPSKLNTPKLEGVYNALTSKERKLYWKHTLEGILYICPFEEERTCHWKGDLNATIEHIFKGEEKQVNHSRKIKLGLVGRLRDAGQDIQ